MSAAWLPQVEAVARGLPPAALSPVVAALAELLGDSAHLEFLLRWVHALCVAQGAALQVRCAMPGARGSINS